MSDYPFTCGDGTRGPCGACADCEREGIVSMVTPLALRQLLDAAKPKEDMRARDIRLHRRDDALMAERAAKKDLPS